MLVFNNENHSIIEKFKNRGDTFHSVRKSTRAAFDVKNVSAQAFIVSQFY